jgi:hypothetical protein
MVDELPKPDGYESADEGKAGRVTRLESLTRAAMKPAPKPDLDLRNQQMVGPRKAAGPPLQEPDTRASTRAVAGEKVDPTDPAATSTAEPRPKRRKGKATKKPAKRARPTQKAKTRTTRAKKSARAKKASRRGGRKR